MSGNVKSPVTALTTVKAFTVKADTEVVAPPALAIDVASVALRLVITVLIDVIAAVLVAMLVAMAAETLAMLVAKAAEVATRRSVVEV